MHDLGRGNVVLGNVVPEPHEHGSAQCAVRGPFREADLRNQLRLEPDHLAFDLGLLREGMTLGFQSLQQVGERVQRRVIEAAADFAGRQELAGLVSITQQEGAEGPAAVSLAHRVPADEEISGLRRFDLEPGGRAHAGLVAAVVAFGDDALETRLQRRRIEVLTIRLESREEPAGAWTAAGIAPASACASGSAHPAGSCRTNAEGRRRRRRTACSSAPLGSRARP